MRLASHTCLIVIPCNNALIVVVRRIARINTIRPINQFEVIKLPVLCILDVQDTSVFVVEGPAYLSRGSAGVVSYPAAHSLCIIVDESLPR